jgi:diguanylate cyclase (GGDEF)-like protein/PAS domain S-box-containing protein
VPFRDLSTLFDLLPIGAYRSSPEGRILRVNAALLRMNGYASEEECFADDKELAADSYVQPNRRAEFKAILEAHGQISDFVSETYRLKTGERIWIREHAHLVRDESGKTLYYEGTIEDISRERSAMHALQQSETLLQNLLQTIPDKVWLKDLDGIYLSCNEAFAAGVNVTPADMIGTHDSDWVNDDFVAEILAGDRLAIQSGKSITIEERMGGTGNLSDSLFEIVKTPMRDAQGRVTGIVGIARDIELRKAAEALLRDTTEQLELAIMGADLGRWDHDLTVDRGYFMDAHSCFMLGRDTAESNHGRAWGHLIHPDDLPGTLQAMHAHLNGTSSAYEAEYRARHTDGRWIWLSSRGKVVQFTKEGKPLRMVGTLMDVTRRKEVERQLQATQAELQATLSALPDLVLEFSVDGRYRAIHCHDSRDLIQPVQMQIDKYVTEVMSKDAAEVVLSALKEAQTTGHSGGKQYCLDLPHGKQWFELSVTRKPTPQGEEGRLIAIARNITERKTAEIAIQHLAFHDSLTSLPNRRMLSDRLQTAINASSRHQQHAALLFLDLDHFKQLNDNHGHDVGDLLLQEVAHRLLQCVRGVDTVARLGGDEFVVLIQELSGQTDEARMHAATVGHKILASLNEPYLIKGQTHVVTPSIGITLFEGAHLSPGEIIKQADMAMYAAKARGKNTLYFYEKIHDQPRH